MTTRRNGSTPWMWPRPSAVSFRTRARREGFGKRFREVVFDWDTTAVKPIIEVERSAVLLEEFATLADCDGDALESGIRQLAEKYGPLGIREGIDRERPPVLPPSRSARREPVPAERSQTPRAEPVYLWREWAVRVRGALAISADRASVKQWRDVVGRSVADTQGDAKWLTFWSTLDEWARLAGLRLGCVGWRRYPRFNVQAPTLFAGVIHEILLATSGSTAFAICVGCLRIESRRRKPRTDRDQYCATCRRRGLPAVAASRRYRNSVSSLRSRGSV